MLLRLDKLAWEDAGGVTIAAEDYSGLITHITKTKTVIVGIRTMAEHSLKCFKSLFKTRIKSSIKLGEFLVSIDLLVVDVNNKSRRNHS